MEHTVDVEPLRTLERRMNCHAYGNHIIYIVTLSLTAIATIITRRARASTNSSERVALATTNTRMYVICTSSTTLSLPRVAALTIRRYAIGFTSAYTARPGSRRRTLTDMGIVSKYSPRKVGLGAGQTQQAEYFGPDCSMLRCPSGDDPGELQHESLSNGCERPKDVCHSRTCCLP